MSRTILPLAVFAPAPGEITLRLPADFDYHDERQLDRVVAVLELVQQPIQASA